MSDPEFTADLSVTRELLDVEMTPHMREIKELLEKVADVAEKHDLAYLAVILDHEKVDPKTQSARGEIMAMGGPLRAAAIAALRAATTFTLDKWQSDSQEHPE